MLKDPHVYGIVLAGILLFISKYGLVLLAIGIIMVVFYIEGKKKT